jgi:hypothetical protein
MKIQGILPVNTKISLNGIPEKLSKYINADLLHTLNSCTPVDN